MKLLLVIALLAFSGSLYSGVYKWTDADGKVHYGDRPVGGAEELRIKDSPRPSKRLSGQPDMDRKQSRQRLLEVYREEREEKKRLRQEQKAERKKRKKSCINARGELERYQNAQGIYDMTESGEREYLSKEQRVQYINRLQREVKKWCG